MNVSPNTPDWLRRSRKWVSRRSYITENEGSINSKSIYLRNGQVRSFGNKKNNWTNLTPTWSQVKRNPVSWEQHNAQVWALEWILDEMKGKKSALSRQSRRNGSSFTSALPWQRMASRPWPWVTADTRPRLTAPASRSRARMQILELDQSFVAAFLGIETPPRWGHISRSCLRWILRCFRVTHRWSSATKCRFRAVPSGPEFRRTVANVHWSNLGATNCAIRRTRPRSAPADGRSRPTWRPRGGTRLVFAVRNAKFTETQSFDWAGDRRATPSRRCLMNVPAGRAPYRLHRTLRLKHGSTKRTASTYFDSD